jgi:hypothetical protein
VVIGERAYATWTEDGRYPAMGFHTRGEMGGIWSPPIKLLDGLWFGLDGSCLGGDVQARKFSSGWGTPAPTTRRWAECRRGAPARQARLAAVVGSRPVPVSSELGPDFRGPQDPAVNCRASDTAEEQPARCDDTAYGKGTGGELRYEVVMPRHKPVTYWFAVAGSD